MLSLSPLLAMSADEDDVGLSPPPSADDDDDDDDKESAADGMDDAGISSRLAFNFDLSNLDENGKPRNKLARKLSRNESEKMRRDRLNAYIAELARLVPLIFSSSRKLDKASILRLTVTYLRIYHDLIKNRHSGIRWKPDFLTYNNLGHLLLESVNGFFLVVNQAGQLIFTTDAFTSILGHSLVDVLGVSIYRILHPEDEDIMKQQFRDIKSSQKKNVSTKSGVGVSGHRSFYLRMIAKTNKPTIRYENIHIIGHLKVIPPNQSVNIDRSEPEVCLIGIGRVVSNESIYELCPMPEENANQWITRHEMDGTITFSDHRGAWLTGFLPGESVGLPAYSLVHPDDISSIVAIHNMILTDGTVPVTVFRMFTKSRDILYIRNNTHIVIDMWTSKPKYIISINEVINEELGKNLLAEQKKKLKALSIRCDSEASNSVSSASSEATDDEVSDDTEGAQSQQGTNRLVPEIVPEPSGNVNVIVGNQKYKIKLTCDEFCVQLKPTKQDCSGQPVFDPDVYKDDGGRGIPTVKPVFLGDEVGSSRSQKSIYDEINTYLGNDPTVVSSTKSVRPESPNFTIGSTRNSSALSNLHAMLQNSSYSSGTMKKAPSQENQPEYCDLSQELSYDLKQSSCDPRYTAHQPPITNYTNYDNDSESSKSYTHQSCNTTHRSSGFPGDRQGTVYVPSTSTRHNPTLVQLLNTKTLHNSHIRETLTSHLVTDGSSLRGDRMNQGDEGDKTSSNAQLMMKDFMSNPDLKTYRRHSVGDVNTFSMEHLQYHQQLQRQQQHCSVLQKQPPVTNFIAERQQQDEIQQEKVMKQMMEAMLQQESEQPKYNHCFAEMVNERGNLENEGVSCQNMSGAIHQMMAAEGWKEFEDINSTRWRTRLAAGIGKRHSISTDASLPSCYSSSTLSSVDSITSPDYCTNMESDHMNRFNFTDSTTFHASQDGKMQQNVCYVDSMNDCDLNAVDLNVYSRPAGSHSCNEDEAATCKSALTYQDAGNYESQDIDFRNFFDGDDDPGSQHEPTQTGTAHAVSLAERKNAVTSSSNPVHSSRNMVTEQTSEKDPLQSVAGLMYQDVTSTSGDDLDHVPVASSSEDVPGAVGGARLSVDHPGVQSPDHQAALHALLTQIAPQQKDEQSANRSGGETLHRLRTLMSDPAAINDLLDDYITTRMHSAEGQSGT